MESRETPLRRDGLRGRTLTAIAASALAILATRVPPQGQISDHASLIVQAESLDAARAAVRAVGGSITHDLGLIDAVGARLTPDQLRSLSRSGWVRRVYADGSVRATGCGVAAWTSPLIKDNKIEWELRNHSIGSVTLSRVEVEWPVDHGNLKKIELAGRFFETPSAPPALVLSSGWKGEPKERQLKSGETKTLKFEFEEKSAAPHSAYAVRLEFAEGCTLAATGDDAGRATDYPAQVGADELHELDIDGDGVTVAIVDTGYWGHGQIQRGRRGQNRVLATFDAIENSEKDAQDKNGHGSHVASVIVASDKRKAKKAGVEHFAGMAPNASLVVVRAFGEDGSGTYADVIRGIDWLVARKHTYGIRVLNCSFSAPARSHYWEDPLNQALMRAWQAGVVVVASAGNTGPGPMTIGVPGNLPYLITVGAITDSYTPADPSDDKLASFSAAGPTYEGFVKPDVVAPGGHIVGIMESKSRIAKLYPRFASPYKQLFTMSGTSQSAAIVSGIAALMLQADPSLSPDDVKCGLMATARAAERSDGASAYSVFQQGAGVVNAHDAVYEGYSGCANSGLDVAKDLAGIQHYGGLASQDANGEFFLLDENGDGTRWAGDRGGVGGYPWSNGYPWSDGYPWSNGYPWSDGYPWSNGYPWADGYLWSNGLAEPASINVWVPQE